MKQSVEEFLLENQFIRMPIALESIIHMSELGKGHPIVNKDIDPLIYFVLYNEVMQAHARLQDENGFVRLKEVIEDMEVGEWDSYKREFLKRLIGCGWLFYSKPTDSSNTDCFIQPVFDPDRVKGFINMARVVDAFVEKDFTKLLMTVPNRIPNPKEN